MIETVPLNIANKLFENLLHHKALSQNGGRNKFLVSGSLPLKGGSANCTFSVTEQCLIKPPVVICQESWLKKENDWHTDSDGWLCYVFEQEWRDVVRSILSKYGVITLCHSLPIWIILNCQWLLNKHLLAHHLGTIDRWQKSWDDWPHNYEIALNKYKRERSTWYKDES